MNKTKLLINEYTHIEKKKFKHIKFLDKFSKSKVYVGSSGLVFHQPTENVLKSLNYWGEKIFSKKINPDKLKYTSNNPIMRSRHYYSAVFVNNFFPKKSKVEFCDFGSGEGNFIRELGRVNKNINFYFTESSSVNYKNILKTNKIVAGFNGSIEECLKNKNFKNLNGASLLWTLCNCVDPIGVLRTIYKTLKKNGILIVSESSRILVPFKKPIYNFFNSKLKTENTHPWFFSYNSLSNLLEVCGFEIIKTNRFFDENDLVIIARKKKDMCRPKIKFDNQKRVISFLKEWVKISLKLKKLTNNYKNND